MTEQFPAQQPSLPSAAPAPTKRKTWPWVAGAIVLVPALAAAFGGGNIEKASAASPTGSSTAAFAAAPAAPAWDNASATTDVAVVTTAAPAQAIAVAFSPAKQQQPSSGQRNATRAAKRYLEYTGFSRSGLIKQLEYDDYSTEDATFAVDSLNTDWNEQAARCAKKYLDYTSFSRSGLIDQLVYDGFTHEQAEYGANAAY
ncbi:Ltp family lipoprotein [Nocardia nova]|uniref:Ltp family lipoprotein n=1 Tax=Nocardia nova TaxID=37330 RepID=UPI0027386D4B|nr:Ltp family lipoprotein [Nocardia nova]